MWRLACHCARAMVNKSTYASISSFSCTSSLGCPTLLCCIRNAFHSVYGSNGRPLVFVRNTQHYRLLHNTTGIGQHLPWTQLARSTDLCNQSISKAIFRPALSTSTAPDVAAGYSAIPKLDACLEFNTAHAIGDCVLVSEPYCRRLRAPVREHRRSMAQLFQCAT